MANGKAQQGPGRVESESWEGLPKSVGSGETKKHRRNNGALGHDDNPHLDFDGPRHVAAARSDLREPRLATGLAEAADSG
jgi:hypothetical protein